MLVTPILTISARGLGAQTPMLVGAVLIAASYIAASFARCIWQLLSFSRGSMLSPSIAVLSRGLASSIASASLGTEGLIFSFATQAIASRE